MMNTKALITIKKYNMLQNGDTVAVCLSGGADSMALFHFLCLNRDALGIQVIALHVNHGLRTESESEEVFVKNYRAKMGAECIVYHADMNNNQKPQGMSIETWARDLRYKFFFQQAEKYHAKLATAHTLSDRRETILFNINRGSSLKGAVGIPAVRDNIIRPLIECSRRDTENYCKQNGIPYVTDKTNFEDIYSRNKIRLKVLPVLKNINSAAEKSIASFGDECEEMYTLLTQLSDNLYKESIGLKGLDLSVLCTGHPAVVKNILRDRLDKLGCLSKDNVQSIYASLDKPHYKKQLKDNIFCEIEDGYLFFYSQNKSKETNQPLNIKVSLDENIKFCHSDFIFSIISFEEYKKIAENSKNYLTYCVNCDKIIGSLSLRTRQSGDSFTFPGRNVTKTLKKLFIEDKIPENQRGKIAVLSDDSGKVIWLEGYGTNKPYVPNKSTEKVLLIKQM